MPDAIANSPGYALSQEKRKRIEQGFGWAKMIGNIRQVMVLGLQKVDQLFVLNMAAYNLTRIAPWDRCVCRVPAGCKGRRKGLKNEQNRPKLLKNQAVPSKAGRWAGLRRGVFQQPANVVSQK